MAALDGQELAGEGAEAQGDRAGQGDAWVRRGWRRR